MTEEKPLYTTNEVHYNVTQGHIQDTAQNWPAGVASFPDGTYPEIFQVQMSAEIRPNQHPIFRAHLDHQQPLLFAEDKRKAANDWIKTWCDATFAQYAHLIWGITDLNEYFSNGDNEYDREQKIQWADAFAHVWANDWQTQSQLAHIRAVLARTAVGNDIPEQVAMSAQKYNAGLAYHCYWPVRDGVVLGHGQLEKNTVLLKDIVPRSTMRIDDGSDYVVKASQMQGRATSSDSSVWFHQRWQQMDARFKNAGITVPFWVSTEIGAVGYSQSSNGDIHLHPSDGWKHPEVYNGNINAFIESLKEWSQGVTEWNAVNGNRFFGGQIFTTNLPHNGWPYYRVTGDELVTIGNAMSTWQPDIDPPPTDELTRLFAAGEASQVIAQMPGTALQENILDDNRQCIGNEFNFTGDDSTYWVCRYAGDGGTSPKWVYMFPVGDYRPQSLRIETFNGPP